jgi:hypothetical protein
MVSDIDASVSMDCLGPDTLVWAGEVAGFAWRFAQPNREGTSLKTGSAR